MFTRVKMSAEEEITRSVYASVVRSRTEKGNKRKNVYDTRRSIEEAVNKVSSEYYFCIQQMLILALKTAFVGLCQVLGASQSASNRFDTGQV